MNEIVGLAMVLSICVGALLSLIGGIAWISTKSEIARMTTKIDMSDRVNLVEENKSLKHRVEVLEAIVTDKNYELNDKIARLK